MHKTILSGDTVAAGGTYTSTAIGVHLDNSAFALYYTVSGSSVSIDFFYYASADGKNYVKKAYSIKRGVTTGTDIVVFSPQPSEAIKIEVVNTGVGDATVSCTLVARTGIFSEASGLTQDGISKALTTIDYAHHETHDGNHFFVIGYQDLTINQVLDFTWFMPNTTKWIHWTWNIETENETLWQVYENVTATNALANAVTPLNSNRNSATVSGTTMKYEVQANLTAANSDTNVTEATLIESGISGAGKNAGDSQRENELIMKQNTLYCLRATATAAGFINFKMEWYEHTNR